MIVVKNSWFLKAVTIGFKKPRLSQGYRETILYCEIGTKLEIGQLDGEQKRLKAQVVRFPHFDPTKERVKGNY